MNDHRLDGLGIVITRPATAAESLARMLTAAGARTFIFPALEIESLAGSESLDAALARLPSCHLAVFVSANAVAHGLAAVRARGEWPSDVRVAAIGDATAGALRNSGFAQVISPTGERHDSEALLALEALKAVEGRSIVIFRGHGGREVLKGALESRGAHVAYVECYRRFRPATEPAPLLEAWRRGQVDAVSILSAETLENFIALVGPEASALMARTALVVPHPAIAARPLARRFARVVVASHDAGLVDSLCALRAAS